MAITKLGNELADGYVRPDFLENKQGIGRALMGKTDPQIPAKAGLVEKDVLSRRLKFGIPLAAAGLPPALYYVLRKNPSLLQAMLIGAGVGAGTGILGNILADKKSLEDRGIRQSTIGQRFIGTGEFSPEAAEKYLSR